ncbi:MAG: FtsX-like permease family protein [Candidatus Aminicenantes bacterium]|nr:FtsX-like permease family protein [Candidatus Aminicenantes bacterium]NIM79256.1 FtsX-like permease family protein [Candidatus Aminicenantes bacterium]NIN18542.1 FtsX-like permease family protein [Candidatus Aminicenantes bacterium]NIN42439.1 FtsX-like permease family protein [Candidatus Aminicenantes bacterium]NIN85197.1 FtsX-like permease family protein [Candidatus Aminicenantes bacterium]
MFKNYLKVALRNILRHKVYSLVNILGLTIGIAAVILILLYVQYEFSFDRFHEKYDRIYRITRGGSHEGSSPAVLTPKPLAPALMDEFPEIISAVRVKLRRNMLVSYGEKNFIEKRFFFTDPGIFKIFSFKLVKGNPETALKEPYSIILSEQSAKKYFGNDDPIGKILLCKGTHHFKVTGILKDIPKSSHLIMDFVAPFEDYFSFPGNTLTGWNQNTYLTYILLSKDADPAELERKFPAMMRKHVKQDHPSYKRIMDDPLSIQPLSKIHLYSHLLGEISANGDIKYIYLFTAIALLILVMACINYMNLATARSAPRSREVGIRKIAGAKRNQLIKQFLGESLILTFIAFLCSILVVEFFLPAFGSFVERDLSLNLPGNLPFVLGILALMVLVGLLAGSYPALLLSSFKPVSILGGKYSSGRRGTPLRNILVVTQFTISIVLIICTVVIKNQLGFIKNRDLGYDRDQIVVIPMKDSEARKKAGTIKTELLRNPDILYVSTSSTLPDSTNAILRVDWPGKPEDVERFMFAGFVDYDFVDLFGIKIVAGRNFSRDFPSDKNGAFLLNESAVKYLGWKSPLGKEFGRGERKGKIVGIMKDFHLVPLHQKIKPLLYYLELKSPIFYLSAKIKTARIPGTLAFLEEKMKTFSPRYPFEYHFFDDIFARAYKMEQKLGSAFSVFAFIAVLIGCLGLLGLASFTAEQKTKEIGIRKVLGSTVSGIVLLFSRQFLKWVVVANIIAWPVAFYAMNKWLQNFAYRTTLGIEIFILSGLIALFIAMVTVSYQSIKAATANPVDALRYE